VLPDVPILTKLLMASVRNPRIILRVKYKIGTHVPKIAHQRISALSKVVEEFMTNLKVNVPSIASH
jgi:hypothetical protein